MGLSLTFMFAAASCDELVTVGKPDTGMVRGAVFESNATAQAAMAGVYLKLAGSSSFAGGGFGSVTVLEGTYADELYSYGTSASSSTAFYLNTVSAPNATVSSLWTGIYNIVYSANSILEGLGASTGTSEAVRNQLTGEALFIRAFCHFYLVNLFGDIPYIESTDYTINAAVSRIPVDEVYARLIADLQKARGLLANDYPSPERVRVNKGAAIALLARVYLYNRQWTDAEAQATDLIENNTAQYTLTSRLDSVFRKTSNETLWQLIPDYNSTNEGALFKLLAPPKYVALRNEVFQAFETGDQRKTTWVGTYTSSSGLTKWYFPYKYVESSANGKGREYSVVLRLAEVYLIRAEARAQQENLFGSNSAESDLNTIRTRAGLDDVAADNKDEVLDAIERERRIELFTEWGHRFFDLKRWNRLDAVLAATKSNWNETDALLPIPQNEIIVNPKLTQNDGY